MDEMPLFTNTCGKIFDDNVVFAFSNGEKKITMEKIAAVRFDTRVTRKALMIMSLPLPVFTLIYLERNIDGLLRLASLALMLAAFAMAIFYSEKKYHIRLVMNDGSKMRISVSKNNKKDAKKFVDSLKNKVNQ